MFRQMIEEIDSIIERDPAARSRLEVFLLYSLCSFTGLPSGFTGTI